MASEIAALHLLEAAAQALLLQAPSPRPAVPTSGWLSDTATSDSDVPAAVPRHRPCVSAAAATPILLRDSFSSFLPSHLARVI